MLLIVFCVMICTCLLPHSSKSVRFCNSSDRSILAVKSGSLRMERSLDLRRPDEWISVVSQNLLDLLIVTPGALSGLTQPRNRARSCSRLSETEQRGIALVILASPSMRPVVAFDSIEISAARCDSKLMTSALSFCTAPRSSLLVAQMTDFIGCSSGKWKQWLTKENQANTVENRS